MSRSLLGPCDRTVIHIRLDKLVLMSGGVLLVLVLIVTLADMPLCKQLTDHEYRSSRKAIEYHIITFYFKGIQQLHIAFQLSFTKPDVPDVQDAHICRERTTLTRRKIISKKTDYLISLVEKRI